jgi:hypothetical protein
VGCPSGQEFGPLRILFSIAGRNATTAGLSLEVHMSEEFKRKVEQWEEKLHSSLYEELGVQDLENESQVYTKTSYNYFYSQAVDEKSLPFLKRMAENKQVYRVRPISDEIFKTIIDNGVPIVFDFKDMNIIVFPDIGTGELRRVLVNGIDQHRLKHQHAFLKSI